VELNRRSKRRWRCRVKVLARAERLGLISESELQVRLSALTAFASGIMTPILAGSPPRRPPMASTNAVPSNQIVEIEPNQDNDESKDQRCPAGAIRMSSEFVDLTLPAHDPSFPKPRGLLPVPQEIEEAVTREEARIVREYGIVIAPEARQRMLNDLTLQYYYESAYVASRHTPLGVEILAVGWDEANQYRNDHPPETRQDVRIGIV
jgi:hypothetical protein